MSSVARKNKPNRTFDHVYVILREELGQIFANKPPHRAVTVVKALWNEDNAQAEVNRLNALNADKECSYFLQICRVERREMGGA